MGFEDVRGLLKQRHPMLMVDRVIALEPGKSISAVKNVTGNELQLTGHFPDFAVMPGTLIVEAFGQAASILFARTTGSGGGATDYLVLGLINEMRFLAPVVPGDRMLIRVEFLKLAGAVALVQGDVSVDGARVAHGKLSFARRSFGNKAHEILPAAP